MIPYNRDPQQTIPASAVKIIGLGGAGANMLERIALDGMEGAELLALNTDIRTLASGLTREKIQLGVNLTKGLGSGGDPELGHQAVLESEAAIRASLKGRRIVFLCAGLGGGTGSGAAPIVTRIAREEGAFVVVFATMPFAFEGKRRREQAQTSLNELAVLSNALVTFDNNRMGELVLAKQGIHEAFASADHMICESIKAVIRLVVRPGLINVGLDDLMSALRTNRSRCLFGSGLAAGKDRAAKALKNALNSPLLDQGALLKDAQTVLVHLSGGEDLTLFEIELLMQRLQKFVPEKAHVLFGAAIDPAMGDSLSITLISALPEDSLAMAPRETLSQRTQENPVLEPSDGFTAAPAALLEKAPIPESLAESPEEIEAAPESVAAAPVSTVSKLRRAATTAAAAAVAAPSLFADDDDERPFAEPEAPTSVAAISPPEPEIEEEPEEEEAPAASVIATVAEPDAFSYSDTPPAPPVHVDYFAPVEDDEDEEEAEEESGHYLATHTIREPEPAELAETYHEEEEDEAIEEEHEDDEEIVYLAADEPDPEPIEAEEAIPQVPTFTPGPKRRPPVAAPWGRKDGDSSAADELPKSTSLWDLEPEADSEPEEEVEEELAPAPVKAKKEAFEPPPFTAVPPAAEPTSDIDPPKLKLGVKATGPQSELSLDSTPRGRFEGETPNVVDGEDLDLPPFLRKKK
jgi:cell division protein FtsZ